MKVNYEVEFADIQLYPAYWEYNTRKSKFNMQYLFDISKIFKKETVY